MGLRKQTIPPKLPLPEVFNKIAFLGEAPGETEMEQGEPFVGASGQELDRMCHEAGILREESAYLNVFDFRLPGNQLSWICTNSKKDLPKDYPSHIGPIAKSQYVLPEYLSSLDRLREELESIKPNIVVALGNSAIWGLYYSTGVGSLRGTLLNSKLIQGLKFLPTYHPAAVLRNWSWRPVVVMDLIKARLESTGGTITRPSREVWVDPAIDDLPEFARRYIKPDSLLSVDIETARPKTGDKFITTIAFSPDPAHSLVVPFVDPRQENRSYWQTAQDEFAAWDFCRWLLEGPNPKLFQNGTYDLQWLYRIFRIPTFNAKHDTLIAHHAMYPEFAKKLDFLASIYTSEIAWKKLRPGKKEEKRDA